MSDPAFEPRELKASRFKLNENFMKEYKGQQPAWGPIGYVTYKRTYARPIQQTGGKNGWKRVKK